MWKLVLNNYFQYVNQWISKRLEENPFSNLYGFARSLLAFGTLTLLLFNSPSNIFDEFIIDKLRETPNFVNFFNLFLIFEWENLIYAKIIACLILIAVISGYYPWLTCILHWWVALSFQTSGLILDGGDQINAILTGLLIPVSLLDTRKNHWQKAKKNISYYKKVIAYLCFITISFQMSYLYFNAAVEKIYSTGQWANGTALYYIFNGSLFGLKGGGDSLFLDILKTRWVVILTWSVIVLELVISYFLFVNRKKRWPVFIIGMFFHFQIAYFFGLVSFGMAMSAGLCLYALPFNISELLPRNWAKFKKKILMRNTME